MERRRCSLAQVSYRMQLRFLGAVPALFERYYSRDQNLVEYRRRCTRKVRCTWPFDEVSFKITNVPLSFFLSPLPRVRVPRVFRQRKTAKKRIRFFLYWITRRSFSSILPFSLTSLSTIAFFLPREESNSLKLPSRS